MQRDTIHDTLLAHACLQKKKKEKKPRKSEYFLINVIPGTNTVPEKRCPIKLYNILNLYLISYFARTAVAEAIDRDF